MKTKLSENLIFTLDSYKQVHDVMYPEDTGRVYSYYEARKGAAYPSTVFFGLNYIYQKWLAGVVVTKEKIDQAEPIMKEHFKFCGDIWHRAKWDYIVDVHGGRLPLEIKSVKEGTNVNINNVLMTTVNTDPNCFWLTNAVETLLQQVWYPTTVATRSNFTMKAIRDNFRETVDDDQQFLAPFYLHDFGQRSTTCMEQAGLGGMGHLVSAYGTDTDMALAYAIDYYDAPIQGLGYSVPADEHSIASALGEGGEMEITRQLIKKFPKGILSKVSDTYNIEAAIEYYCTNLKSAILARDGKFVARPDSPRFVGDTPKDQILAIARKLDKGFGSTVNRKGYTVINPKVGEIYGDGLSATDILQSLASLKEAKYAASTCVYGQGSGLLQKLDRDTQRFAFKSCAQQRGGVWYDIFKNPLDKTKASKTGHPLALIARADGSGYDTEVGELVMDNLHTSFLNGEIVRSSNFQTVRNSVGIITS